MTVGNRGRIGKKLRRRREPLTAGDRLVCAGCGALMGLTLWTFLYGVLFLGAVMIQSRPDVAARIAAGQASATPWDVVPSYWYWGGLCAAAFALFGALAGPERMMDGFETVSQHESDCADHAFMEINNQD